MSDEFFFDPRGVKRDPPYVPAGQYIVVIDKAMRKESENANGIKIYFKIISGPYLDKVFGDYFNINHSNPEAQRIGRQNFAYFLDCIDMGDKPLKYDSDIENKIIKIEVDVIPHYKNNNDFQNKVRRYFPLNQVDLNLIKDLPKKDNNKTEYNDMPF
jgi:hypothetical protein